MKADLYVQGRFWATIDVPHGGLLSLLAQGMITQATQKALQLQQELDGLEDVHCCISLAFTEPIGEPP